MKNIIKILFMCSLVLTISCKEDATRNITSFLEDCKDTTLPCAAVIEKHHIDKIGATIYCDLVISKIRNQENSFDKMEIYPIEKHVKKTQLFLDVILKNKNPLYMWVFYIKTTNQKLYISSQKMAR